jgi:translocation and assembly module TamA
VQEAVARYVIPVGDPSLEKLEFSTGYVNEDLGDLESERIELAGGLTQVFGSWQRVLFLKLNHETTTFPDGTETQDLLLIPGISYASLPPNFLTGWVRDAAYYIELSGSPQSLGSDASYLRFYSRAERVWPIAGPWHVRLRGEFGTSWVDEFSELPASQRFFAGGDRSVRGFALDELSPQAESSDGSDTGESVGGEHKIVGSIELERDFSHDLRGAVFFDTGNAFTDWSTPLEYSVGIGLRWKLPMLMIGVDVAQALSEPGKNPRLHLNITQVL